MDAQLITDIIEKIKSDSDYLNSRRIFHENYEWFECYCRKKYNANTHFNDFINDKAQYYWSKDKIKEYAKSFASIECVGANEKPNYVQSVRTAKATMYLRFHCNLFDENIIDCNSVECSVYKKETELCTSENGALWCGEEDDSNSAFKALMYIVKQIRNNLFHGHKMTLDPNQFLRDKELVKVAASTTSFILDNLIASE